MLKISLDKLASGGAPKDVAVSVPASTPRAPFHPEVGRGIRKHRWTDKNAERAHTRQAMV